MHFMKNYPLLINKPTTYTAVQSVLPLAPMSTFSTPAPAFIPRIWFDFNVPSIY